MESPATTLKVDNPLSEFSGERVAPPAVMVVFGASGDLTSRKLMPAVEQLGVRRLLPTGFSVVGVARTEMDDDGFREMVAEALDEHGAGPAEARQMWDSLSGGLRYVNGEYADPDTFVRLAKVLDDLDATRGTEGNRLYYLATPPSTFTDITDALAQVGLNRPKTSTGFVRIVFEKPFGHDAVSAAELDGTIHRHFDESQVYRIDHYLGKETVQNLLALRFANAIFEPIWNRQYVDHVQITVAEALGVGHRGSFYEQAGALRDIVQNHVLQVLALTLMEPPASFDPDAIRDEKVKALRAVDIYEPHQVESQTVRAQYGPGWVQGADVVGYRDEDGVNPHSERETFVAMRLMVDNWRWAGVPVYVRTGKRLPKRVTEVAMEFKSVPHLPFGVSQTEGLDPASLVLRIQPDEGIALRFGAKVPGQDFRVRSVSMDFSYGAAFLEETPEAYERLLLDALVGDPTLFIRTDEVAQAWRICDPVLAGWDSGEVPLVRYDAGSWGPWEAEVLLAREGRRWRRP